MRNKTEKIIYKKAPGTLAEPMTTRMFKVPGAGQNQLKPVVGKTPIKGALSSISNRIPEQVE